MEQSKTVVILKSITILALVLILVGGVFYITSTAKKSVHNTLSKNTKFTASPLGQNAYKIFPGPLSRSAKQALTGFSMQIHSLSDGTTQVTILAKKQDFTSQVLIVKPGYSVYFTDQRTNDDTSDIGDDSNLQDDRAVVVNSNGYIVNE